MEKLTYTQLEEIIEQIRNSKLIAYVKVNEIIIKPSYIQLEEKLEEILNEIFPNKTFLNTYEVAQCLGMCKASILILHHSKKLKAIKYNPLKKNSPLRFFTKAVKEYFIDTLLKNL